MQNEGSLQILLFPPGSFKRRRAPNFARIGQGQVLAVWILAAKLPNSDLNFAVDLWVDCIPPVFLR